MEDLDPGDEEESYWKEVFRDDTEFSERNGKLGWIWRNGLNLGKKIVVTGAVVSSAPFVLPPLVALTTIGVALSVPAGFVIVTYACGEKLMNALLPMPSPPPFQQYELMYGDEVYNNVDEFSKYVEAGGQIYEQDAQKGLDIRIELVDRSNEENYDYDRTHFGLDEVEKGSVSEIIEEEGCEEDVGEYIMDEEQTLDSKAIPYILEGINEAENEISSMEQEGVGIPRDSLRAVVVEAELGGENESSVEQVIEDVAFLTPREMVQTIDYGGNLAGIDDSELKSETTSLIEKIRDEGKVEQYEEESRAEETLEENDVSEEISEKDASQDMGIKDLDVIPEGNEPPMDVDKGVLSSVNSDVNSDYLSFEEDETIELICDEPTSNVENQLVVNVRIDGDHIVKDYHQGDKMCTSMLPNEDTKRMDDVSGFDTFNTGSITRDLKIDSQDKMLEEDGKMADENGFDLHEHERIAPDLIVDSLNNTPEEGIMADENGFDFSEHGHSLNNMPEEEGIMADENGSDLPEHGRVAPDLIVDSLNNVPEEEGKMVDENGFVLPEHGRVAPDLSVDSLDKTPEEEGKMADENMFDPPEHGRVAPDLSVDSLDKTPDEERKMADENLSDLPEHGCVAPDLSVDSLDKTPEEEGKVAYENGFVPPVHRHVAPDLNVDLLNKTPEEDRKIVDENEFELPEHEHVAPDSNVDSLNKTLEEDRNVHTTPVLDIDSLGKMSKGEDEVASLGHVVEVTVDYHEVVIESATPLPEFAESKPDEEAAAESDKVKLAEEKIWEQINAMRTIVGYTDTRHNSYAEELEALYIFTGVEPPVSSKDPADLADINEKLHFLMSIVGVK